MQLGEQAAGVGGVGGDAAGIIRMDAFELFEEGVFGVVVLAGGIPVREKMGLSVVEEELQQVDGGGGTLGGEELGGVHGGVRVRGWSAESGRRSAGCPR